MRVSTNHPNHLSRCPIATPLCKPPPRMDTVVEVPRNFLDGISTLCDACKVTPWGEEGWKDFFTRESFRTHLQWMDSQPNMKRVVCYDVKPEQFYQTADICAWCSLLKYCLGLPTYWEQFEPSGHTNLAMSIEFWGPAGVAPETLNYIMASCIASSKTNLLPFRGKMNIFSRPGGI